MTDFDWMKERDALCGRQDNADALEAKDRRIAELEAAIDEAIEYVAGHDDKWPKALVVRLRAALEKKND